MKKNLTFVFSLLLVTTGVMAQDIDRSNWTVTTQTATDYGYARDGWDAANSVYTAGNPEQLLDGDPATYIALVKPGKSYAPTGGWTSGTQDAAFIPSFTVDMKSSQTFDYIKWHHRFGPNPVIGGTSILNYLRVYGVDIYGSNTGQDEDFTKINTDGVVWISNKAGYVGNKSAQDDSTYTVSIPESTYRYVRVKLSVWSDIYKTGEGYYQNPDQPGDGQPSGSTMQIGEFGIGKSVSSGIGKNAVSGISIPATAKAGQAFTISLGEVSDATISIYTVSGVKISGQKVGGSITEQTIDSQGIYIVEVKTNTGNSVSKIIVK